MTNEQITAEHRLGVVHRWIDNDKGGFGFLKLLIQRTPLGASAAIDKGHPDVFLPGWELRKSGINRVQQGDVVSFVVQPAAKGPMAVDVEMAQ